MKAMTIVMSRDSLAAIRSSYVRPPGPSLDDVTRAELRAILERKLLTS
jgi:hypothetical protein